MHLQDTSIERKPPGALEPLYRAFIAALLCILAFGVEACGDTDPLAGNLVVMDAYTLTDFNGLLPSSSNEFVVVDVLVRNPSAGSLLVSPASFRMMVGGFELAPTAWSSRLPEACPSGFVAPGGLVRCEVAFEVSGNPSRLVFASYVEGDPTPVRREARLGQLGLEPSDVVFAVYGLNATDEPRVWVGADQLRFDVKSVTQTIELEPRGGYGGSEISLASVVERRNGVDLPAGESGHPNFKWRHIRGSAGRGDTLLVDVIMESPQSGFDDSSPFELIFTFKSKGPSQVSVNYNFTEVSCLFVPKGNENYLRVVPQTAALLPNMTRTVQLRIGPEADLQVVTAVEVESLSGASVSELVQLALPPLPFEVRQGQPLEIVASLPTTYGPDDSDERAWDGLVLKFQTAERTVKMALLGEADAPVYYEREGWPREDSVARMRFSDLRGDETLTISKLWVEPFNVGLSVRPVIADAGACNNLCAAVLPVSLRPTQVLEILVERAPGTTYTGQFDVHVRGKDTGGHFEIHETFFR